MNTCPHTHMQPNTHTYTNTHTLTETHTLTHTHTHTQPHTLSLCLLCINLAPWWTDGAHGVLAGLPVGAGTHSPKHVHDCPRETARVSRSKHLCERALYRGRDIHQQGCVSEVYERHVFKVLHNQSRHVHIPGHPGHPLLTCTIFRLGHLKRLTMSTFVKGKRKQRYIAVCNNRWVNPFPGIRQR